MFSLKYTNENLIIITIEDDENYTIEMKTQYYKVLRESSVSQQNFRIFMKSILSFSPAWKCSSVLHTNIEFN